MSPIVIPVKTAWFALAGWILLLGGSTLLVSCAHQGSPPGGPEDRIPPMVETTWPEPYDTIEATRDPVKINFSERISERLDRGRLNEAVLVSPVTGEHQVKHSRAGLEISVIGGFQPGLVYRVRVLPVIRDMFNNSMEGPLELVFSTGGDFEANVLAGTVKDRITGESVEDARVEVRSQLPDVLPDGVEERAPPPVYFAKTDTAGIFILRYLPSDAYEILAYLDNNRNEEPDFREGQGEAEAVVGVFAARADTTIQELTLLQPDTTPAIITRIQALDSTLLEVTFDDFLNPDDSLDSIEILLQVEEGEAPQVENILWQHQLDSLIATNDSIRAADSLIAFTDSLQVVADSLQIRLTDLQASGDTIEAPELEASLTVLLDRLAPAEPIREDRDEEGEVEEPPEILPDFTLFALLDSSLLPGKAYTVTIVGVRNINGLEEGGGQTDVTWNPPEPPPGDSIGGEGAALVPPDTTSSFQGILSGLRRDRPL